MTRINSPRGIFLTTMTCRRPLYFFLLLSRAGLVFFQAQPQCCYHCNAFTISHALRSERTQKYQFAANDVVVAGGSRLFSTYDDGVGHCLSSPPDIDEGDSHNHHHLHQQQNSRNRREFIFQSIATASSIASLFPYLAFADDDYITPTSSSSSSSSSSTIIIDPAFQMPTITQTIYLDIKFENYVEPKRLVIGLFGKDLPRTVENFVMLCTNKNNNNAGGMESGNGASYVGSTIYRGTDVLCMKLRKSVGDLTLRYVVVALILCHAFSMHAFCHLRIMRIHFTILICRLIDSCPQYYPKTPSKVVLLGVPTMMDRVEKVPTTMASLSFPTITTFDTPCLD